MEAAVIQELILCSPKRLPSVAKKFDLSVQRAKVVRDHWTRRITSRCVKCNVLVEKDKCPKCKTPKQPALKLLKEIKPKEVILRRECHCGKPFYYSAGYILEMFEKTGTFKPSSKCEECRTGVKKTKKKKKAAVKKTPPNAKKSKKVKIMRPKTPKSREPQIGLTYRPFQALRGLKVKNRASALE